jgi:hypothetical protein
MPLLVCVLTATLLPVQSATAQDRAAPTITISPVPMVHVLQPGPAPAARAGVTPNMQRDALPLSAPGAASAGLIIVPTFDVSITSDPNAAAIEAAINAAIAAIESQFSDPITVNITFQTGGGLGSSGSFYASVPYATFLAALKSDAKTSDDATAVGLLPNVTTNPVTGGTTINVKTANLRAIGINANLASDGTISVNTAITNPGSPGSSGTYNLIPVVLHEIDEVLGLGSSLPTIPGGTIFPEDLYRYSSANTRTFTATDSRSSNVFAYFSIDAMNFLAEFDNQSDGGDFGDWQANPRRAGVPVKVQDAFAFPGANPAMSVELTALDVIGYDRVPVVTPVVTADTVTPNAGAGATQTFVLAYSDTAGATDLRQTWVWFNPTFSSSAHSCLAYYQAGNNTLNLLDDAGATWLSLPLGSGTLQNSQCAIALGSSTAVRTGNTLTLTLALTFKPAFAGVQTIFMYATNGTQTSGWQTRGTWTSGPLPVLTADSVTPNAGTGAAQAFVLSYTDTAGATDLRQTWVWFNPAFTSSAHSCLAYYQPGTNTLNLLDDAGATWLSAPLGSGTLQNSQCGIALANSTAVPNGNTLTLTLAVTFKAAFAGAQTIFMYATNGTQTSGWQTRGTWTVPAAATPVVTADSETPSAGTGATQTFALAYSDTAGATDLRQTWVWFNPTFSSSAHSCLMYYDLGTQRLNLLDDAGATWMPASLGSGTLQNSQCAIALGSSTAAPNGNTLTLTLAVAFKPAFAGTQTIFMYATNGTQTSGWQTRGSWTVPAAGVPVVTADSVTPNTGTGATQSFALAYSDTAGASDLRQTWVWFNPTFSSSAHSCLAYYDLGTQQLNLLDDTGTTWLQAPLGSGTLQNSQCGIALGNSTAVPSVNTLTLTLAVTFNPSFAGTETIFMYATNGTQTSGWQTRGTWSVVNGVTFSEPVP